MLHLSPNPRLLLARPDLATLAGDPDYFHHPAPLLLYPVSDSASRPVRPLFPSRRAEPDPRPSSLACSCSFVWD